MTAYLPLTVGVLAVSLLVTVVLLILTGIALRRADRPNTALIKRNIALTRDNAALTADLQRQARINERLADRILQYRQWADRHLDCPHHDTTHPTSGGEQR